jgi:hypothetical protein
MQPATGLIQTTWGEGGPLGFGSPAARQTLVGFRGALTELPIAQWAAELARKTRRRGLRRPARGRPEECWLQDAPQRLLPRRMPARTRAPHTQQKEAVGAECRVVCTLCESPSSRPLRAPRARSILGARARDPKHPTPNPAPGSARLGSARLGSARLGSARLDSTRLGSAPLDLHQRSSPPLLGGRPDQRRLSPAVYQIRSGQGSNTRNTRAPAYFPGFLRNKTRLH